MVLYSIDALFLRTADVSSRERFHRDAHLTSSLTKCLLSWFSPFFVVLALRFRIIEMLEYPELLIYEQNRLKAYYYQNETNHISLREKIILLPDQKAILRARGVSGYQLHKTD